MKPYFITAAGTGVGKTLLTCALSYHLRQKNLPVRAIKPVISGFDAGDVAASDTGLLLAAQGLGVTPQAIDAISPWRFKAALSPGMAAEDEGSAIDFDRLVAFCRQQQETDYLLIESAGGVMTPLDAQHTMLDWAVALSAPVILVTGSYLGALSHTLASARAITTSGLTLHAVVVSESEEQPVTAERTLAALQRFLPPGARLHLISRLDSCPELWKYVADPTASVL